MANRVESTSSSQLPSAPDSNRNYYNATNNQAYNNPTQFNSYFSVYDDEADDTGDLYRDGKQTHTHSHISGTININNVWFDELSSYHHVVCALTTVTTAATAISTPILMLLSFDIHLRMCLLFTQMILHRLPIAI